MKLTGETESEVRDEVNRFISKNPLIPKKDLITRCIEQTVRGKKIRPCEVKRSIKTLKGQLLKCYAGKQTENRGGHIKGFPLRFEEPTCFLGRMLKAASWKDLRGQSYPGKPWLDGVPRLIFISDMGDALSASVPFEYLQQEIIEICGSPKGRRHIWLWVSKRPARMAELSEWLLQKGIPWPDNLVAMTTVTSRQTLGRVAELCKVKCKLRGLSVEPLWSSVKLPLKGIDWVIVGGESGVGAQSFHLEWAREIRQQCRAIGVPFFMKQMGRKPIEKGTPLSLADSHGGDWSEWPEDLRIREVPESFRNLQVQKP